MHLHLESLPTHIGTVLILTDEQQQLRAVDWSDYEARMHLAAAGKLAAGKLARVRSCTSITFFS
jgi:hypothetical protein